MRNFIQKLSYKLGKFMYGRYGVDEISNIAVIIGVILMALSYALSFPLLYIASIAITLWSFWRCFSKNVAKRTKERQWFLSKKQKFKNKIKFKKDLHEMKKTHRLYKCKKCKTILRVPKGVGKIKITCAKCKTTMIKRA